VGQIIGVHIPAEGSDFSLIQNAQWVLKFFHRNKVAGGIKLTPHYHLVPRLRMSTAIPQLPLHVDRDNVTLTFICQHY